MCSRESDCGDAGQHRERKEVCVAFTLRIDISDFRRRLLFGFVVGDEQTSHRAADGCRLRLHRIDDDAPRSFFLALVSKRKCLVRRAPQLLERFIQKLSLSCDPALAECVGEVGPDPLKLSAPCGDSVVIAIFDHVPHRERQRVEIVLNSEKLQRFATVFVDGLRLQATKTIELAKVIERKQRDDEQRQRDSYSGNAKVSSALPDGIVTY